MSALPQLNLPPYRFKLRKHNNISQIWDPIRRVWLVLTPEEWVRQHFMRYVVEQMGVDPLLIKQEHPIDLAGSTQRADMVIYSRQGTPFAVVECKAAGVKLDNEVLGQVVRYNSVLNAPYIILTNGIKHICCKKEEPGGKYIPMETFPRVE